jgi:hypothetical protein
MAASSLRIELLRAVRHVFPREGIP